MTDKEIDLLVQGFVLPLPYGFTKEEKKEIFNWIKSPSIFVEITERRKVVN